ncbi:MAG: hypothetical protein WD904_09425 [Dehalococcoidia bacterium]
MISRTHFTPLLAVAVLFWSVLLILNGQSVSLDLLKPFSTVAGAIGVVALAFERWIWRWRYLYPWFVSTPNLQGTWSGQLVSDWKREDGSSTPPIVVYLVIRQTLSTISMRLLTPESSSVLLGGNVTKEVDGVETVTGIYLNTPDILRRDRSPIHHGGMILQVQGHPPARLEGEYWTDRGTKGRLCFTARSDKLLQLFDVATT